MRTGGRWLVWVGCLMRAAAACTLFGAAGEQVDGGGCLLAKIRDWKPEGEQSVRVVRPPGGRPYLSLSVTGGSSPGCKAGVNADGFAVVIATVGTIPKAERSTSALLPKLLARCGTVADALAERELLRGPRFLLLADRHELATVEIGPGGALTVTRTANGTLVHTNHYLLPDLLGCNQTAPAPGTRRRLARATELLGAAPHPLTLDALEAMTYDQHDGPDNSLFRTGSRPGGTRTMATFVVAIAPDGSSRVIVRLLNPGEPEVALGYDVGAVLRGG